MRSYRPVTAAEYAKEQGCSVSTARRRLEAIGAESVLRTGCLNLTADCPIDHMARCRDSSQVMSQPVATFRPALAKYTRWARGSFGYQQYEVMDTGWQIETPDGVKLEPMTKSAARTYARERGWSVRVATK